MASISIPLPGPPTLTSDPANQQHSRSPPITTTSNVSTPGHEFPGAYPRELEVGSTAAASTERRNNELSIPLAGNVIHTAKSYMPEQVEHMVEKTGQTAAHYLPIPKVMQETVAAYWSANEPPKSDSSAPPSSMLAVPQTDTALPTKELRGNRPCQHGDGVGELPGRVGEAGVAVLPDERTESQVEGTNQRNILADSASRKRQYENQLHGCGTPPTLPSSESPISSDPRTYTSHMSGVGALPGRKDESGVAILPDQRTDDGVTDSGQGATDEGSRHSQYSSEFVGKTKDLRSGVVHGTSAVAAGIAGLAGLTGVWDEMKDKSGLGTTESSRGRESESGQLGSKECQTGSQLHLATVPAEASTDLLKPSEPEPLSTESTSHPLKRLDLSRGSAKDVVTEIGAGSTTVTSTAHKDELSIPMARNVIHAAKSYMPEQVEHMVEKTGQTATHYLPIPKAMQETVTAYWNANEVPKSYSSAPPTSMLAVPRGDISLPSTELRGNRPAQHQDGVGELPGTFTEAGVAILPDERREIQAEGTNQTNVLGDPAFHKRLHENRLHERGAPPLPSSESPVTSDPRIYTSPMSGGGALPGREDSGVVKLPGQRVGDATTNYVRGISNEGAMHPQDSHQVAGQTKGLGTGTVQGTGAAVAATAGYAGLTGAQDNIKDRTRATAAELSSQQSQPIGGVASSGATGGASHGLTGFMRISDPTKRGSQRAPTMTMPVAEVPRRPLQPSEPLPQPYDTAPQASREPQSQVQPLAGETLSPESPIRFDERFALGVTGVGGFTGDVGGEMGVNPDDARNVSADLAEDDNLLKKQRGDDNASPHTHGPGNGHPKGTSTENQGTHSKSESEERSSNGENGGTVRRSKTRKFIQGIKGGVKTFTEKVSHRRKEGKCDGGDGGPPNRVFPGEASRYALE